MAMAFYGHRLFAIFYRKIFSQQKKTRRKSSQKLYGYLILEKSNGSSCSDHFTRWPQKKKELMIAEMLSEFGESNFTFQCNVNLTP